MNNNKLPEFKTLYDEFKKTDAYATRLKQTSFAPIAKKIIEETLKNEPLKNEHLTGLIQILKWNTTDENFDKYLAQNIQNKELHDLISEEAYRIGEPGYTNAGKTAITTLIQPQLTEVRKFLSDAFSVETVEQAKELTDSFDALNIPEVKRGIYSPWLHYINPEIFPIINNTHKEFNNWIEMDNQYSACIESYAELKNITNEPHLAMLDTFAYSFKPDTSAEAIKRVVEKLREKFPQIWRCRDSDIWDDLKNQPLLTFNWLDKSVDYKNTNIDGHGQKSIHPWVNQLKAGDLIFVMGKNSYNGICIADSEYDFNGPKISLINGGKKPAIKVHYIHLLDSPSTHNLETHNNPATFASIDAYKFSLENVVRYLNKKQPDAFNALQKIIAYTEEVAAMNSSSTPKNVILYGPPGTGKTYTTIDMAVSIADGASSNKHEINKAKFDVLRKEGRIEFVTFHQNYSYEDFMVGLKPDVENEQLRFRSHRGIFYEVAQRARDNYLASKGNVPLAKSFEEALNEKIGPFVLKGEDVLVEMTSGVNFKISDITDYAIHFKKPKGDSNHSLSIQTLRDIIEAKRLAPSGLSAYYNPFVAEIKQLMTPAVGAVTETLKNYVLVIDEINRANISRVFGELITLLEDDKRLGEENELRITLPNGETDFCVPPNLFIIGTMNTADKSIALIDIALRRRFEFIAKYPEYEIEGLNAEESALLKKLNASIYEKKKSADYLIGHAYFMKKLPIDYVLKNRVILS